MTKLCATLLLGGLVALTGCTSPMQRTLPALVKELKADPATVECYIVAPGYTVQFKRCWPTNAFRGPVSTIQVNPQATVPNYPLPLDPMQPRGMRSPGDYPNLPAPWHDPMPR